MGIIQRDHLNEHHMNRGEDVTYFWRFKKPFTLMGFHVGPEKGSADPSIKVTQGPISMTPCRLFARHLTLGDKFLWGVDTFIPVYALSGLRFSPSYEIPAEKDFSLTLSFLSSSPLEYVRIGLLPIGLFTNE